MKTKMILETIICESCGLPVGDGGTLQNFSNNPFVIFPCRCCGHKTHIKNPYFTLVKNIEDIT